MSNISPQEPSFDGAALAIAKARSGNRDSPPAPRHKRTIMGAGNEVPDVSVLSVSLGLRAAPAACGLVLHHSPSHPSSHVPMFQSYLDRSPSTHT